VLLLSRGFDDLSKLLRRLNLQFFQIVEIGILVHREAIAEIE